MKAQNNDPIWALGTQLLEFPDPGGVLQQLTLPTSNDPAIPNTLEYQGTAPAYTQNVQFDADGNVLFFIVDGNIYNRQGLLIADNDTDPACRQCFWESTNRIAIIPAPGSCTAYYIVSTDGGRTDRDELDELTIQIGLLDMALVNDHPSYTASPTPVYGKVAVIGDNSFFDLMDAFVNGMNLQPVNGSAPDDYTYLFTVPNTFTGPFPEAVRFDVVETSVNGSRLMVLDGVGFLAFLNFTPTGPVYLNKVNKALHQVWESNRSVRGEVEAVVSNGTLKVACSLFNSNGTGGSGSEDDPPYNRHLGIAYWEFVLANVLGGSNLPVPGTPRVYYVDDYNGIGPLDYVGNYILHPRVSGLEFSPNTQLCYYVKSSYSPSYDHNLGFINLALPATDPAAIVPLNIGPNTVSRKLADSELEMNVGPNGTGNALYAIMADQGPIYRLATLSDPNNPNVANWNPNAFTGVTPCLRTSSDNIEHRVLNARVANSTHRSFLQNNANECCAEFAMLFDASRTINGGNAQWSYGNNPFGNTASPIYIEGELRLATGTVVQANGMEFLFGPNASLVIEPGARLTANNCIFTSSCNRRWQGIRVNGNSNNLLQQATQQGVLYLNNNSKVINAHVGVWCATLNSLGQVQPNGYGGRVHANNSSFLNNVVGVRIETFRRWNASMTMPLPNLSYFNNCDFITNAQWPDQGINAPSAHAHLQLVDRIRFTNCSFRNDNASAWPLAQWGWGIRAYLATVNCTGAMDYGNNRFADLQVGAFLWNIAPTFISKVDGMGFKDNGYGLMDVSSPDSWYTNNRFDVHSSNAVSGSVGLYLWQSDRYTVERNLFTRDISAQNVGVGVWFEGPNVNENRIYDNTFENLNASCVVNGRHGSGLTTPPVNTVVQPGLQLLCNDHTNTLVDHLLLQGYAGNPTSIRNKQGIGGSPNSTVNNRFFTPRPSPGPTWDILPQPPFPGNVLDIKYYYLQDGANDPSLRPRWIHDTQFNPLSLVDDYYDLYVTSSPAVFDKVGHCIDGELDLINGGTGPWLAQYNARLQELSAAIALYNDEVDQGETPDLLAAIYDPALSSAALRNLLQVHSPLSNEVMIEAARRQPPMDQWHLTQVLLTNSRLDEEVLKYVEEENLLNSYFLNLLRGESTISAKQLLEMEIALRHEQKTRLQHALITTWAEDTLNDTRLGEMMAMLEVDESILATLTRYMLAVEQGDHSAAENLASNFGAEQGYQGISAYGALHVALGGDLSAASEPELESLWGLMHDHESQGSAHGWAAMLATARTDSLPPIELPMELRSISMYTARDQATHGDLIRAFPNPTSDRILLAPMMGLDEGLFEVFDAQGRQLAARSFSKEKPFVELDVRSWPSGAYVARLVLDGGNVQQTRFTIVR